MANFIETFLTTRGFEFTKDGEVTQRVNSYVSRETYRIAPRETLRGLKLTVDVITLWSSLEDGVHAVANDFKINMKTVQPENLLEELRKYL